MILWDNNKDHDGHRFDSLPEFMRALDRAHTSGKGFRLAYTGDPSPDAFEVWAHGLWEILDGNKITHVIIEEYSDCCRHPGSLSTKTDFYHRRLWTQGRKYGANIHATTQRPQLISKDALGQAGTLWASAMDVDAAQRVAKEMNLKTADLMACEPGEFYYRNKLQSLNAEKIRVFHPL